MWHLFYNVKKKKKKKDELEERQKLGGDGGLRVEG